MQLSFLLKIKRMCIDLSLRGIGIMVDKATIFGAKEKRKRIYICNSILFNS